MSAQLLASVVIPTRDRRASLARTLAALARQAAPAGSFEVIVAVDRSTDGTLELLHAWNGPPAPRIAIAGRPGRAAACNAGSAVATAPLIVLLDDDMEPEPAFVMAHCRAHDGAACHAVIGAVPVRLPADASPLAGYTQRRFATHLERLARPGCEPELREFFTGNFSVSRELLRAVGGFDEGFREYGHEDIELWVRLRAAGARFAYCAEALAWQTWTKDMAALARDAEAEGRTAVQLARKHPEVASQLKLGTWEAGPAPLRALRGALLAIDGRADRGTGGSRIVANGLLAVTGVLERHASRRTLDAWYPLAHGFFYWRGVRAALRKHGLAHSWPPRGGHVGE